MSLAYRTRIGQLIDQLNMSEAEKQDKFGWCGISDEVIRKLFPNQDIDSVVEKLSEEELKEVHEEVMRRYRLKRKKVREQITGRVEVDEQEEAQKVEA